MATSSRLRQSFPNRAEDSFLNVPHGVEWMNVQSVAEFSREHAHPRVHAGEEDRNLRILDRTRIEEGRHEDDLVEPALEFQSLDRLPGTPDQHQRAYQFPPASDRSRPLQPDTPLDGA